MADLDKKLLALTGMPFAEYVEQVSASELSGLAWTGPGSGWEEQAVQAWENLVNLWERQVRVLKVCEEEFEKYKGEWAQEMVTIFKREINEQSELIKALFNTIDQLSSVAGHHNSMMRYLTKPVVFINNRTEVMDLIKKTATAVYFEEIAAIAAEIDSLDYVYENRRQENIKDMNAYYNGVKQAMAELAPFPLGAEASRAKYANRHLKRAVALP